MQAQQARFYDELGPDFNVVGPMSLSETPQPQGEPEPEMPGGGGTG